MLFGVTMFPIGDGAPQPNPVAEVTDGIGRARPPHEVAGLNEVIEGDRESVLPVIRTAERLLQREHRRVFVLPTVEVHAGKTNRRRTSAAEMGQELGRGIFHSVG